jgi:hypothetical protein
LYNGPIFAAIFGSIFPMPDNEASLIPPGFRA